jgi:Holliday junction DNA helicase RuvA
MIGKISGILTEKKPPFLMVDVNGISYELQMPVNGFFSLPEIGKKVTLPTHMVIREDGHFLFAFADEKQKSLFRTLIKVNGIGPKLALNILSGTETDILVHSILAGDDSSLVLLPGIGKKMAQRLILELRNSLEPLASSLEADDKDVSGTVPDAISALIALGYKPHEAHAAIAKHKGKQLSREDLIRMALKDSK